MASNRQLTELRMQLDDEPLDMTYISLLLDEVETLDPDLAFELRIAIHNAGDFLAYIATLALINVEFLTDADRHQELRHAVELRRTSYSPLAKTLARKKK